MRRFPSRVKPLRNSGFRGGSLGLTLPAKFFSVLRGARVIRLFLVLALCFPSAPAAQTEWPFPGEVTGDRIEETDGRGLVLRSNPPGARVFIDGIERGITPLHLAEVRAGNYFVRIEKDGYSGRRFRLSVRPGSVLDVSVELKEAAGRVLVRVRRASGSPPADKLPLDPKISVNGQSFSGPALELPEGFRTIRVRAFGWEEASATVYVGEDSLAELTLDIAPARFGLSGASLSRVRFNPANAASLGTTAFNFEVSGPGSGNFAVLDSDGNTVFTRRLPPFETWAQSLVWDGRNGAGEIAADGIYTLVVTALSLPWDGSAPVEARLVLEASIDSTRIIYPLTLSSGKSGLLFAPLPSLLPAGSFQIEGSLLAGSPPASVGVWKSLPFSAAFRFSPYNALELSAALNVTPRFGGDTAAGAAGTVKWVFLDAEGGGRPVGAAAGVSAAWTRTLDGGKGGFLPFGIASGIEVFFPFSFNPGKRFSFALTPAALWTSDEGFPWEGVPRLVVSGGLLMKMTHLSAGLSIRSEFRFASGDLWPPPVTAGAEIKFFPPPSSFVFSFLGGVWARDGNFGGFGGLGIGMIH